MSEPHKYMSPDPELPPDAEIVSASGVCTLCDRRFHDERVWRFSAPGMPDGFAYIEVRHVN